MATRGLFLIKTGAGSSVAKVLCFRRMMAVTRTARAASTDDVVRDIFFIDDQNGWLVCEVNAYQLKTLEELRAYLMKTTDGGEHLLKRVEIKGLDVDSVLVRAVFSRNGRGWTFGEAGLTTPRRTTVRRGHSCVRRQDIYSWVESLSTTIVVGL